MKLFPHQIDVLEQTKDKNRVAYYLDMGLGKTFVGSEKMIQLNEPINLLICQKSKIDDWIDHFKTYYSDSVDVYDLTDRKGFEGFETVCDADRIVPERTKLIVGIINYELSFRRPQLKSGAFGTIVLDESSLIQNETAKRSKFILKLNSKNVILLSGTPTSGKYERLFSQLHLLGWGISKKLYWNQYVETEWHESLPIPIVKGYKNVDRLKQKLRDYGAVFMKSSDVLDLPKQNFIDIRIPKTKHYAKFHKNKIVDINGDVLVGEIILKEILYKRQLCGLYSKPKLDAFRDLAQSTEDRLIVFYNFTMELMELKAIAFELEKPVSVVNGSVHDLDAYEQFDNSITFIQYQAGAMGLNLQKANQIVYFTPPLSSEQFEQSKKRIHRIGQDRPCYYYKLKTANSIEESIYSTLAQRKDYTDKLFVEQND